MSLVLCSRNLTLGLFVGQIQNHMQIKNSQIVGPVGRFFDRLLTSKNQRNCQFRSVAYSVEDHSVQNNSLNSLTGFYLMRKKQLDLLSMAVDLGYADEHAEATKVATISTYQIGQFLRPSSPQNLDFSYFLFSNLRLIAIVLIGFLLITAATTVCPALIHPNYSPQKSLKLMLFRILYLDTSRLPRLSAKLALIFLTFNLFWFFNSIFLSGNIGTDKLVVPTDEVIDSIPKLMASPNTLVISKFDDRLLSLAPEASFLGKLSKKSRFLVQPGMGVERPRELYSGSLKRSYMMFSKYTSLVYIMLLMAPIAGLQNMVAFLKPFSYHETLGVYYMRRSLDEQLKAFIHKSFERHFESGLILDLYDNVIATIIELIKADVKIFDTLEGFVEERSKNASPNVKLDNVSNLFITFLVALTFVAFVFALHWPIRNRLVRRKLKMKLRRAIIQNGKNRIRRAAERLRLAITFLQKLFLRLAIIVAPKLSDQMTRRNV